MSITITRYGRRNWAVYVNDTLLCVAVYLKGAKAVRDILTDRIKPPA